MLSGSVRDVLVYVQTLFKWRAQAGFLGRAVAADAKVEVNSRQKVF